MKILISILIFVYPVNLTSNKCKLSEVCEQFAQWEIGKRYNSVCKSLSQYDDPQK